MFDSLEELDRALLLKINAVHTPLFDKFMWFMSETWPTIVIVFAVAYAFHRKYSAKKAVEFLVGCAIVFACTDLSTNTIKHGVKRYRPSHNTEINTHIHLVNDYKGGEYGFFSAHAANTVGVITFIFMCVKWVPRKYRVGIFIYPFVVCYSRMYLGVHYPSDILVGTVDGVVFGIVGYYVMNTHFLKLHEQAA